MRRGVFRAKVIPDELFQIREIDVEVFVKGVTPSDMDGQASHLVSAVCDERHSSRQILNESASFGPKNPVREVQVNPQRCATASCDLLGNELWILAFEVDVRPKFRLVKYGVPPVSAHPNERHDTPGGRCRGVMYRWGSGEGEDGGEDILGESVDRSLVVEKRLDLS